MSQISGKNNGMIVNKKKHQALILGKTEHNFCFPVNNSIDIFGMTIDNRLSFDNHVSVICKKINNQFNVMLRFRKLINKETLLKLHRAFILPHFYYCSSYGLHSFSYLTSKIWNSLPDTNRTIF